MGNLTRAEVSDDVPVDDGGSGVAHEGWGSGWSGVAPPVAPSRARIGRPVPALRKERRRRAWRTVLWTVLGLVILVVALAVWLAIDAMRARAALEEVSGVIPGLEQRLREDPRSAAADLASVQVAADRAASATSGPPWTLAGAAPWVGDDVRALSAITSTVDRLASDVLPRLSAAAQAVTADRLAPEDGRVELQPLVDARDDVVAADRAVGSAIERIAAIPREGLVGSLSDAADLVHGQLTQVRMTTATAARAVELLPPMLGADGPREWLVLAQNNAEPRATGGIPGAVLLVRADDGEVTFEGHASSDDFGRFDEPVLELSPAEKALFGAELGQYVQDVNFTPDFPRTAELAREMWQTVRGGDPRGVLSIDPVVLESLLRVTGPVTFQDPEGEDVTLTGQNAAAFLLADIYDRYEEPLVQDAVFATAAEAVFTRLTSGGLDAGRVMGVLATAAEDGRLMVWSDVESEQDHIRSTVLSGELRGAVPTVAGGVAPEVGVYLNMTTAGKVGYYLRTTAAVEDATERPDGSQEFLLRVRLENTLSEEQVADLPAYVLGNGPDDGTIRTNLLVYAPLNGGIREARSVNAGTVGVLAQEHDGVVVGARTVSVSPGEAEELEYRIVSGKGQRGEARVRLTPGSSVD